MVAKARIVVTFPAVYLYGEIFYVLRHAEKKIDNVCFPSSPQIDGGVVALCGKVWVPKHDPSKYPVCPDCKRIYEEMTR